jgi:peptidyl-prolyl cis-trans isomerase SurA
MWGQDGTMDRIVAVVGKEIILKSDLDGQMEMIAQRNPSMDKNDAALRQQILDLLINERLVYSKAIEDSIEVTDDEVTQQMEMQIQSLVQQFGSEQRIESLYGMSMARIRRDYRDDIRKQLLSQRMKAMKFATVKASRADVDDFYNRYKDSLQSIPARMDLYHIVKYVKPSAEKKQEALVFASKLRDSILNGTPFADIARRHSADPGSAANGGDLGFAEKGKFVPSFEKAAFALEPGEISQPVESPFGFHVIQLVEKTANAVNTRHVLVTVGSSDADKEQVRKALLDIKQRVEKGEDFLALAKQFSEEKETQGFGGSMGQLPLSSLPSELTSILMPLPDGGVTEPLAYAADPTKPGYHIIFRKALLPEHAPTVKQDYKILEQLATMEKQRRVEQQWMEELRRTMYWEVR